MRHLNKLSKKAAVVIYRERIVRNSVLERGCQS